MQIHDENKEEMNAEIIVRVSLYNIYYIKYTNTYDKYIVKSRFR